MKNRKYKSVAFRDYYWTVEKGGLSSGRYKTREEAREHLIYANAQTSYDWQSSGGRVTKWARVS